MLMAPSCAAGRRRPPPQGFNAEEQQAAAVKSRPRQQIQNRKLHGDVARQQEHDLGSSPGGLSDRIDDSHRSRNLFQTDRAGDQIEDESRYEHYGLGGSSKASGQSLGERGGR